VRKNIRTKGGNNSWVKDSQERHGVSEAPKQRKTISNNDPKINRSLTTRRHGVHIGKTGRADLGGWGWCGRVRGENDGKEIRFSDRRTKPKEGGLGEDKPGENEASSDLWTSEILEHR